MHNLVARDVYLDQLIQNKDVDLIKIITGIRRCGKSTLLDMYHSYLLAQGIPQNRIIYMNLESLKYDDLKDYRLLYAHIADLINGTEKYYLLFDEIQQVDQWEKAIESFRLDYDVDIYITGSNAFLLSGELATLLSGRYVEIKLLPLSFKEFKNLYSFKPNASEEEKFKWYLQFGGMPVLGEYNFDIARINQALEGIYSTVVLRDVIQRNSSVDITTLNKIMRFICSNIGSITSPNNIGNVLSTEGALSVGKGKNIAGKTIEKYIEYLRNAYIVYPVSRYDIKGKELLKTLGKNYIVDMGFRNILLGYRDVDRGHILENIVFLELLRRDYRVYIGKYGDMEIDFIAEKADERIYVQVTESLLDEQTRNRELRPLRLIRDNYEKIILSMDQGFITSYDGIKAVNLIDWLSQ